MKRIAALWLMVGLAVAFIAAPASWAQSKSAHVGYLGLGADVDEKRIARMKQILAEKGWIQGKNLVVEVRYASGEPPQYTQAAKELAALKLDFIFAAGTPALRAQFAATRTIPIVTSDFSSDPLASGYADSYNRPGKNVAGVFLDAPQFAGKWLDILKGLMPRLKRVAVLWNPSAGKVHLHSIEQTAKSFGIRIQVYEVQSITEVEKAFSSFRGKHQAVVILPSPLVYAHSARIAELALKDRLPAVSMPRSFAEDGGTVSYGPNRHEVDERVFNLASRILEGAKPSELPIETPTRFDFLINTKTAQKLGLKVPDRFLVGAELVGK
ncbi:MAG: ABC transporter substrate-binding protein [Burkholderiales bacterium]